MNITRMFSGSFRTRIFHVNYEEFLAALYSIVRLSTNQVKKSSISLTYKTFQRF